MSSQKTEISHRDTETNVSADSTWFFFTLLFIIVDYGRPQDILPIGFLRPAMIIDLVLLYYIFREGNWKRYSSKQVRYLLYFIALLACYVPLARNNFYAWRTTKTMLLYLPFILSVIATVTTIDRLKKLVFVLVLLMVYVSQYCLRHGGVGSGNYFADENDVSLYINMYLPFCYFLLFYEKKITKKIFYGISLCMGLAGIILSFSRGGFVGLLAMGTVVWFGSNKKIVTLLLLVVIGGVFYVSAGDRYLQEMSTVTDTEDNTAKARIESWKAGVRMFADHPLGVGGGNFVVRFPEYQGDYFKRGMWGRAAHSLWFTLIPELGIPGMFIYFTLLYYNIKDIFFLRRLQDENNRDIEYLRVLSMALLASFAGYFAAGSFISVLYYAHYWYLISLVVSAVNIAHTIQQQAQMPDKKITGTVA